MRLRSMFRTILFVFLVAAVTSGTVFAAKTGPGVSTGTGQVFLPNPVADLQDQSLTDQKDANYAALQPAYHIVSHARSNRFADRFYEVLYDLRCFAAMLCVMPAFYTS